MTAKLARIGLLLLLLWPQILAAQTSGTTLPANCTAGATFSYTAVSPPLALFCTSPNVWTVLGLHSGPYAMADNTPVPLFTVAIPTSNTGCSIHTSFTYTVTNSTNTVSHSGIVIWTIVNQNGTVTGTGADSGESIAGTGCGAGCDSWSVAAVGTLATASSTFNNTLSQIGSLTFRIINDSCPTTTFL